MVQLTKEQKIDVLKKAINKLKRGSHQYICTIVVELIYPIVGEAPRKKQGVTYYLEYAWPSFAYDVNETGFKMSEDFKYGWAWDFPIKTTDRERREFRIKWLEDYLLKVKNGKS